MTTSTDTPQSTCPSWCREHPAELAGRDRPAVHIGRVDVFGWTLDIDQDPEEGDQPRIVVPECDPGISAARARTLAAALLAAAHVVDPG